MTLLIKPQREPFARVQGNAEIVRGPAYWRLRASVEKYCRGRTLGRSFVISGNRGAGKTTMVLAVIEDLRRQSELERGEPFEAGEERPEIQEKAPLRRPMFVSLSGPDIMRERVRPQPSAAVRANPAEATQVVLRKKVVTPGQAATPTQEPNTTAQQPSTTAQQNTTAQQPNTAQQPSTTVETTEVVETSVSTPSAHATGTDERARKAEQAPAPTEPTTLPPTSESQMVGRVEDSDNLLRQIARALHLAVAKEFAERFELTLPDDPSPECLEAAAQLQIELHAGAKLSALRRFWDLSGRFFRGVLFRRSPDSTNPVDRAFKWDRQGLKELVALDASADAYRIAIGKIEEDSFSQTQKDEAGKSEVSWADQVRNLAAPFAGLLGGAATGLGIFQGLGTSASELTKTLSSVGAALLSALVLTFSLAPKRTSTAETTLKFSRDNGVGSLAWRLSGVVDALFQASLMPVFVIDELDKITLEENLGDWIETRAQELKSLLTERAFFCFLTGRGFADKLHRERTARTYPPSYTQFSNYLFVNYLPSDLHKYLNRILDQRPTNDHSVQDHEDRQMAILAHVVLFRAEMHPIDIQRELNSLVVKNDAIELYPQGQSVPRVDAFSLLFQVAVEFVLSDEKIQRRMRDDPRFALLAIDAVYYAPRKWRAGEVLDISLESVEEYLKQRRAPDEQSPKQQKFKAAANPGDEPSELPDSDKKLLRQCVLNLVALIQRPTTIHENVSDAPFVKRLIDYGLDRETAQKRASLLASALPQTEALLEPVAVGSESFNWRYDVHGFPMVSAAGIKTTEEVVAAFRKLEQDDQLLKQSWDINVEFCETCSLLQASMKWQDAVKHARRLEAVTGIGDAAQAMVAEALSLKQYCDTMNQSWPRLSQAIMICGTLAHDKKPRETLPLLSRALELSFIPNDERGKRIESCLLDLNQQFAVLKGNPLDFVQHLWRSSLQLAQAVDVTASESLVFAAYLDSFRAALGERIRLGSFERVPNWTDVAMLLAKNGTPPRLTMAWKQNTASLWTELLLVALKPPVADRLHSVADRLHYPSWLAPYALALLGFTDLARSLGSRFGAPELSSLLADSPQAVARRNLVIVAGEPSALAIADWSVSSHYAALVVSRSHLSSLASALAEASVQFSAARPWFLWESTEAEGQLPPEQVLSSHLPKSLQDAFPPSRRVQLFAREPAKLNLLNVAAQALMSTPRYIVAPHSIDEAVSKADQTEPPA